MQSKPSIRYFILVIILPLLVFNSCDSTKDHLPLISETKQSKNEARARSALRKAKDFELEKNYSKATSAYKNISKKYPLTYSGEQATYHHARLLEKRQDPIEAFKAYQQLITSYPNTTHYSIALERQESLAYSAVNGLIRNNFLGIKTRIAPDQIETMLTQIRNNAPQTARAQKAQFNIGKIWQKRGAPDRAISAYQSLVRSYPKGWLAPEAYYQIGEILLEKTKRGNQNSTNLTEARKIYQQIVDSYPNHPRAKDASKKLALLQNKSIKYSYKIAEFYRKKGNVKSAIYYYQEVLNNSTGGEINKLAKQRIRELRQ